MKLKTLIHLVVAVFTLLSVALLASCTPSAGNTQTIRHHPHQHGGSR